MDEPVRTHGPGAREAPSGGTRRALRGCDLLLVVACLAACSTEPEPVETLSPRPRVDLVETLRADLKTPRHSSDGGGRAWLDAERSSPLPLRAGTRARLTIVYEAGPLGIADGGVLFLQAPPFWGWSTPQTVAPEQPGYTRVTTAADGVELEPEVAAPQLLAVRIVGRGLSAGERVEFEYGAGEGAARVDDYAESEARVWLAVDGDGDGVRALVPDPPTVEVDPGPAAALVASLPSTAAPGERVRLTVAIVDARGNGGVSLEGAIRLRSDEPGLDLPAAATIRAADGGSVAVGITARRAGLYRIRATLGDGLTALSNPLFVTERLPKIYWGDLHGHSGLSDGTGTPSDYLRYARDVAGLDVAALTDHDHWGLRPLAMHPELWDEIGTTIQQFHEPGRFVALAGYEWTSWLHGHRHVLYFENGGLIHSSLDPAFEHPRQLWDALRGKPALTFAHHSAGEPVPTNWAVPPDPELEPVTEVVSVHGSSEAADAPVVVRGAVPGNFVRDALDRGYRLGLIGSGDSHDGHPGLTGLAAPSGGLAALLADELTREGVRDALLRRAVYATSGPRILLHTTLDGATMGSELPALDSPGATSELVVLAIGTQPVVRIDIVRSGAVVGTTRPEPSLLQRISRPVDALRSGDYLYVRVVQADGGTAWSSPFFGVTPDPPGSQDSRTRSR